LLNLFLYEVYEFLATKLIPSYARGDGHINF